ncbi:efflux RND transporter permease subunit [Azoarcus sp. KH32C]|uniref:efflux RND transporter permease subunit n=1 Tax=Azoarcus sp. KH32C TaxID=748247 RepID=UPI0002386109|nr:efflux RND transporter permease subunit [Azoarcus sp. KH32C]BAL23521.1 acriflavin resistance protein [Azoarcus sp. KH32C]
MNVSAWSIRNPVPGVLLFIMLSILGLFSFARMKVQNFPDVDLPMVVLTATLPGAAPSQLETEVARKIENSLATLQGVKHIYTRIQDGVATITTEFRLEKPTQEAIDDVRDAFSRIRSDLPGDLRDPVISRFNLSGLPIVTYTVASDTLDEENLSWFVDNTVSKALLSVSGVGQVSRVGGVAREIRIELDPERLLALNVTVADISRQLRRIQMETSAGRTDLGGSEQTVRTLATALSAEQLAAMEIVLSDGRRVELASLGRVEDTVAERRSTAMLDGKPVVGFEVVRARGAGEIEVARGVAEVVASLQAGHPRIRIKEAYNFVDPVEESYKGSLWLLVEGAILAVIVVWFFLRDWRATFVSATALPLSVLPAFVGMDYFGFSLNVVTLLSLSLVIGILVDDAIVEIENIVRHLGMGKSPYQAAMEAADEIGLAVIATTFALIAVFLPTAFMNGISGKFFKQFGWTATLAILASLLVARLLTPMMSAYLLRPTAHVPTQGKLTQKYLAFVTSCLRHRALTLIAATGFFLGSLALIPLLPTTFMPPDDLSQTLVSIELPPGSRFEDTLRAAEQARTVLARNPNVVQVYTAIGSGSAGADAFALGGAPEVRKASLTINLTPRKQRTITKQAIEAQLRDSLRALPGVRVRVGLGGGGEKYAFSLKGDDNEALLRIANAVERDLRKIGGLGNISSSASLVRPEVIIRPDFARAADLGVTAAAIADSLRIATSGDYDFSLAKLNLSERQVPIVVRLPESARTDIELLARLPIPGKRGNVMLGNVADISVESGPSEISRFDRKRNINFDIELTNRPLGEIQKAIATLPSLQHLPPGTSWEPIGDAQEMQTLFESFAIAMVTGVLCIYIVLVLLFHEFAQPLTILAALPLALGGAFVALLLARSGLSMPSLIGLIMLMGVTSKNSILLVEYAIVARREFGLSRFDALIDACSKRARPIVMTTIAMGAGMLPIALGLGVDPSFRAPMAIAVIGGLVTSTFLSLLVIPVVYTLVADVQAWIRRRHRSAETPGGHPAAPTSPGRGETTISRASQEHSAELRG